MKSTRKYPTIGSCGIDCGLCPRYYTKGGSQCPGCGGMGFEEKHPSCGVLTCCVARKGKEVCAECGEYPCHRFKNAAADSFVTHGRIFDNQGFIREKGLPAFLKQQQQRMEILNHLLAHYDDGRSKSFYCIGCTLLPPDTLKNIMEFLEQQSVGLTLKERNRLLRERFLEQAKELNIELALKKKGK